MNEVYVVQVLRGCGYEYDQWVHAVYDNEADAIAEVDNLRANDSAENACDELELIILKFTIGVPRRDEEQPGGYIEPNPNAYDKKTYERFGWQKLPLRKRYRRRFDKYGSTPFRVEIKPISNHSGQIFVNGLLWRWFRINREQGLVNVLAALSHEFAYIPRPLHAKTLVAYTDRELQLENKIR